MLIAIPQEKKLLHNLRKYEVPLQRYMSMMDLQVNCLTIFSSFFSFSRFSHSFYLWISELWVTYVTIIALTFILHWSSGEEREAFLQASDWQCWGITSGCIHTNSWRGLPKVWEHLSASTGSIYQSEREVCYLVCCIIYYYYLLYKLKDYHLCQRENSWGAKELAWEDHSSYRGHWWWAHFGSRRPWVSGKTVINVWAQLSVLYLSHDW